MSKSIATTLLVLLEIALLIASGCVELTGQRISWFYDAPKDELHILIHYDGIHGSDDGDDEQVREFVKNGDVMFLDWIGHIEMADLREQLQDPNTEPLEKDWVRLVTSIKTKPVGYYREPDGRMGAAQLVTITEARAFVRKLNGLISREILEEEINKDDPMARTEERIRAAAKNRHQWLTLDGHSIRCTLPVHTDEWLRARGKFLADRVKEIVKAGEEAVDDEMIAIIQALSSMSVSYIESADQVTFVLGRAKTPSTLRMKIRDEYEPSLEKVVVETVKVDLDKALAEMLLDKDAKPSALLSAVRSFGPPEEQVRALMAAAQNGDDKQKKAAIERLGSWAKQWNRDHGVPKAPKMRDKLEDYITAWKKWYGQMRQYPIFKEKDDAAEAQSGAALSQKE
jgi:hypothetical protein